MIFTWYPHYITINPPNIVTCRFLQRPGEPFIRERFTFASSFSTWPSEAFFLKHMFMTCSWKTMRWLILGFTCAIRRLTIFEASVGVWTLPSFVEHFYILTPGKKDTLPRFCQLINSQALINLCNGMAAEFPVSSMFYGRVVEICRFAFAECIPLACFAA